MSQLRQYTLVNSAGETVDTGPFHNFREAANQLGLTDQAVAHGWKVIEMPDPQISRASSHG